MTAQHTIHMLRSSPDVWQDPWGNPHTGYVIVDILTITEDGSTYRYDNGYDTREVPVAVSPDGRRFHKQVPIDYGGQTTWVEIDPDDPDAPRRWQPRLAGRTRYVTPDGEPVLPGDA